MFQIDAEHTCAACIMCVCVFRLKVIKSHSMINHSNWSISWTKISATNELWCLIEGLKLTARWRYCACFSSSSFEVNLQSCPFYSTHSEVSKLPISGSITKYYYNILLFYFGIDYECKVKSCTFTPWLRQKTRVITRRSALETGKL